MSWFGIRSTRIDVRFYSLMTERDLFGTIRLVRNWGRIGTKGQERWRCATMRSRQGGRWRRSHEPSGGEATGIYEAALRQKESALSCEGRSEVRPVGAK